MPTTLPDFTVYAAGDLRAAIAWSLPAVNDRPLLQRLVHFAWADATDGADECDLTDHSDDEIRKAIHNLLPDTDREFLQRAALAIWKHVNNWTEPEPEPPRVTTLLGVISGGGVAGMQKFEKDTGVPLKVIRAFPAGRQLQDGLHGVDQAISGWPGVGVLWSTFMAGKNFTDAQLAEAARQIRARADRLPWLDIAVDAEPDRKDRSYSTAQFLVGLERLRNAVGPHPKIRWVLNLTGYLFNQRIGTYTAALPMVDVLAVDPYWRQDMKPSAVQGGKQDNIDAAAFAKKYGLAYTWGETGCEQGSNQVRNLNLFFDSIEESKPEYAPYFQNVGAQPITCVLQDAASYATYRQRAEAL